MTLYPSTAASLRRAPSSSRVTTAVLSIAAFVAVAPLNGFGSNVDTGLVDLSLEQLANVEIKSDIASIRARPIEEVPGIVSVVSQQQIADTGARDLSDVLMLVPGFALDSDLESMVGLTFRGMMGQEGKVLLILDGIEMNEPLYGSLPIYQHFPADSIAEVEIIRGPGSSVYGGTAGLSVIRVTTKGAEQNGGYASFTPSFGGGRFSEIASFGEGFKKGDWRYAFNGSVINTSLSERTYTDTLTTGGTALSLAGNSTILERMANVALGWRDLDLRLIYDSFHYDDSVDYGSTITPANDTHFDSLLTEAKYVVKPTQWLKITPQLTWRHQVPWFVNNPDPIEGNYNIVTDRYQGEVTAVADLNETSSLLIGVRAQRDTANARDVSYGALSGQTAANYFDGNSSSVSYDDYAGYFQYDVDTPFANLSLGGRYENQSAVGGAFVPRIAATRAWKQFHLKALYSEASRIPAINVLQEAGTSGIVPEKTVNYELEAGYKFSPGLSWVGNVFLMGVDHPIHLITDPSTLTEVYVNGNKISTYGLESEVRWDQGEFSTYLSYSLYLAGDNAEPALYGDSTRFLAAPTHKISLSETWHVTRNFTWNINSFWLSQRLADGGAGNPAIPVPSEFVLNTFANYTFGHWSYGLGVSNLLNVSRFAPQPYTGGTSPLPLRGREVFGRVRFSF